VRKRQIVAQLEQEKEASRIEEVTSGQMRRDAEAIV
jgi:hypothetical protein